MTAPSYTDWHCGMKVVLTHGAPVGLWPEFNYPEIGKVYTIRSLFIGVYGRLLLRLVEVVNREALHKGGGVYEPGLEVEFFRPVQTRQTDISIFTAMLSPKPAKAKKVRA